MIGIAEMFAELDGRDRYEHALAARAVRASDAMRRRWRLAKQRQRAEAKKAGKRRDQSSYKKRYATDPEFRERRRAYWRNYSRSRKAAA